MGHWEINLRDGATRITESVHVDTREQAERIARARNPGFDQTGFNYKHDQSGCSAGSSSGGERRKISLPSSGGSGLDLDQTTGLVILGGGLLAFFTLTPFIMSGLLGTAGTWVAGKATNYSLQEYADTKNPSDNESKKALTILVSAIVLGTIGFGWGDSMKKGWDAPTTSMIENVRKA